MWQNNNIYIYIKKYRQRWPTQVNTAISRKVVGKTVLATTPKGNMAYGQCTFPDTVAVE